jgi:hypothetical protein
MSRRMLRIIPPSLRWIGSTTGFKPYGGNPIKPGPEGSFDARALP